MTQAQKIAIAFAPVAFLILWSGGYSMAKLGLRHADPMTFLAMRYALVLMLMWPLYLIMRPRLPQRLISWVHLAVTGLLMQAIYFGFSYLAFDDGLSAGGVALIVSLQPILVAIAAPVFVAELVSRYRWVGLVLGLIGAGLVIGSQHDISTSSWLGVAYAVIALVAMSSGSIYEKRFGVKQHIIVTTIVQFTVGFLVILPIALARENLRVDFVPELFWSMSYLVIGNSIIAVSLLLYLIRAGEVSRVSALLFLVPPVASLMAWFVLGEQMPLLAWVGMALAGAGVLMASRANLTVAKTGTESQSRG